MKPNLHLMTVLCLASAGLAVAQENSVVQMDEAVLQSESVKRDAIIEVFTPQDVEEKQIDDLDDIVRLLPGITVSKGDERWGSSGFNIRGLDEDRVGINVDGVSQGETLKYEGGQAYGYFKGSRNSVDVETLKAIEVVKGADSIISGSGALAGAVNYTTKDAADYLNDSGNDLFFGGKFGYSSINDETMGSGTVAARVNGLEALIVATHREGHEYENFDMSGADIDGSAREVPDPSESDLSSVLAKLGYAFGPSHRVDFTFSNYDSHRVTESRSFNGSWYKNRVGDDTMESNRYGLLYAFNGETPLFDSLRASVNRQEVNFEARTLQSVFIQFGPTPSADEDRVDIRSFDQELTKTALEMEKHLAVGNTSHDFLYGVEFYQKEFANSQVRQSDSNLNDLGWVENNLGALIPASEADIYTLYALDSITLNDRTSLRVGGRFDSYTYNAESDENFADETGTLSEIDFSAASWTIGIDQRWGENLTFSAGMATGFRAPTIEEMYSTSGSVDDWTTVANPDLESESVTNFDVSVTGAYELGTFRAGVYYSKFDDFIDYEARTGINTNTGQTDPNGFSVPVNAGEVEIKGVELSGYLDLSRTFGLTEQGWGASMVAAYSEGESENGDPLYTIQPLSASIGLDYRNALGKWGASLNTTYTAGKDAEDSYTTESDGSRTYPLYRSNAATVWDFTLFYKITENTRITAGVYNLTDKEYYNWDSVRFVDQGDLRPGIGVTGDGVKRYSEAGRNFKVDLSFRF